MFHLSPKKDRVVFSSTTKLLGNRWLVVLKINRRFEGSCISVTGAHTEVFNYELKILQVESLEIDNDNVFDSTLSSIPNHEITEGRQF